MKSGDLTADLWQCNDEALASGAQVFVMILAGYETTANALAFAVYLVSTNPAKRDRLLAEIDTFGRTRAPTLHDLDRRARHNFRG